MSNTNQTEQPQEQMARLIWTIFIVMFFLIQATIWTVAITVTSHDPSHATVAGYHDQTMDWNLIQQAKLDSQATGWSANFTVDPQADIRGIQNLMLHLLDRQGNAVSNARLQIQAFHRGHAANPQQLDFNEIAPGQYAATIHVKHFGKWRFSGSAVVQGPGSQNRTADDRSLLIEDTIYISKPARKL